MVMLGTLRKVSEKHSSVLREKVVLVIEIRRALVQQYVIFRSAPLPVIFVDIHTKHTCYFRGGTWDWLVLVFSCIVSCVARQSKGLTTRS